MVLSLVYVLARRAFELVVLLGRRERSKELEILVLRHELSILRRQVRKPRFAPRDRLLLAALSRVLPRRSWRAFSVKPETLLRWHRRLVANHWTYPHRRPGRPPIDGHVRELILRLARENKNWGYLRIVRELRNLGIDVSATLVRNVLRAAGVPPAPSATGRTGARSCASTPQRRSPVTSSPSTPSCCGGCTCWCSCVSAAAESSTSLVRAPRRPLDGAAGAQPADGS